MDDCKHDLVIENLYGFRTDEKVDLDAYCRKCDCWFEIKGGVIQEHDPSWNEEESE